MRNTVGDRPLGKRAALRARLHEVSSKVGNSALSLALVMSLVPAPSIAYALGETEGDQTQEQVIPAQSEGEKQQTTDTTTSGPAVPEQQDETTSTDPAPKDEPATTDPAPAKTAPEQSTTPTATTTPATPAANADAKKAEPATQTSSSDAKAAPATEDNSGEPTEYEEPTVSISGTVAIIQTADVTVEGGVAYSQKRVFARVALQATADGSATSVVINSITMTGLGGAYNMTGFNAGANPTAIVNSDVKEGTYDFSSAEVEYTFTYNDAEGVERSETDTATVSLAAVDNGPTTAVVDETAPKVTIWAGSSVENTCDPEVGGDVQTRYLDLSGETKVTFTAKTEDTDFASGKLTLTWVDKEGNQIGEPTEIEFADGSASTSELSSSDFIDAAGNLKYAVATFSVKDFAGNEATATEDGITAAKFTSENAWVEDAELKVSDGQTGAKDKNDKDVYKTDVALETDGTYVADTDKVTTEVKEGETALEASKGTYTVAAEADEHVDHTVTGTFTTPHGAKKESTVVFAIDTTLPDPSVELSGNADTDADGTLLYYADENDVTLTVTVDSGTEGTLDTSDPFEIVAYNADSNEAATRVTAELQSSSGNTYTYKVRRSQEGVKYYLKVTPKTIFGETVTSKTKTTKNYLVDKQNPLIMLNFSGPMHKDTTDAFGAALPESVAVFFKDKDTGEIGNLTITVTDTTLKTVTISGVQGLTGAQKPTEPGKYEIVVPYVVDENGTVYIGEGKGHSITVEAEDSAKRKSTYVYNGEATGNEDSTTTQPENTDATTFDIDTTSVQYVSATVEGGEKTTVGDINVYDASSVNVKVTVSDDHFDANASQLLVSTDGGENWEAKETTWTGNGPEYTGTITLEEDANKHDAGERVVYQVKLVGNDRPVNKTTEKEITDLGKIALDSLPPALDVTYSPDTAAGNHDGTDYYKEKVTATITAKDPFFNRDSVTSAITATGQYELVSGWTEDPDNAGTWTAKVKFTENDGDTSTLDVTAVDLLGHDDTKSKSDFIVDLTDPVVTAVTFDQQSVGAYDGNDYYTGPLTATVQVYDINFNTDNAVSKVACTNEGSTFNWDGTWTEDPENPGYYKATLTYDQSKLNGNDIIPEDFVVTAVDYATRKASEKTTYGDWSTEDWGSGSDTFVIDTDKPEITVEFTKTPVGALSGIDYYDAAPTATITVVDRNFDPKSDEDATALKLAGGKIGAWSQNGDTWTATVEFGENREGDYANVITSTLGLETYDKAYLAAAANNTTLDDHADTWMYSNVSPNHVGKFIVDLKAPEITVSIPQQVKRTFGGKDFYADDVVATITVVDNNFDTNSSIKVTGPGKDSGKWSTTDNKTYTRTVTYGENTSITSPSDLYIDAYDLVFTANGKAATPNTVHEATYDYKNDSVSAFIVDKTAPAIDHVDNGNNPATTYSGIQFFNSITSLKYYFKDAGGLYTVELNDPDGQYVLASGTNGGFSQGDTASKSPVTMALAEGVTIPKDAYERNVQLKVTDIVGNARIWTINDKGEIVAVGTRTAKGDSGSISIDKKGIFPEALVQDTKAPTVTLSPTTLEGNYYNTTQTVTATVNEFNFDYLKSHDSGRVIVTITKYEGNAGRAMSTRTVPVSAFTGSGSNWANTMSFADDGHYIVEAQFMDIANNMSNKARIGEFTIDKTAPVITIDFDNNNSRNGNYYNAERTATITVIEHNFDPSTAVITSNGVIGGWSSNGDTHVATVYFGTDGHYDLSVAVTDKAGNSAQAQADPFIIDLTAPTLEFYINDELQDPKVPTAWNEGLTAPEADIECRIAYADNEPVESATYEVEGNKDTALDRNVDDKYPSASVSGDTAEATYTYVNELIDDDIYTLKATVVDNAGNETSAEYRYSINRFGSNFEVIDEDSYKSESGGPAYINQEGIGTIKVREINVSPTALSQDNDPLREVAVTHGLDTTELEEQAVADEEAEGFYVDRQDDPGRNDEDFVESYGWSEQVYNVYNSNFPKVETEEDAEARQASGEKPAKDVNGLYSVVISSTDAVENRNVSNEYVDHDPEAEPDSGSNVKVSDATVQFILDNELPDIANVNFDADTMYNHGKDENKNLTFTVSDNFEVAKVTVELDGEEIDATFDEETGTWSVPMEAKSFTKRGFTIRAYDEAGNVREYTREGVRNTANIIELYWPFLLGALGVGGAGAAVVVNKRRKEEGDAA